MPGGLEDAVHRALDKDPARRFTTVTEFSERCGPIALLAAWSRAGCARGGAAVREREPGAQNEYLSDGITDE